MRNIGFVAGGRVYAYSNAINIKDVVVKEQWFTLNDLQGQIIRTKGAAIKELERIVIIDKAIFSDHEMINQETVDKKVESIIFTQGLIKQEAYGVKLVVYTLVPYLYNALQKHFADSPGDVYLGTNIRLGTDDSYKISGLVNIFNEDLPSFNVDTGLQQTPESEARSIEYSKEQREKYQKEMESMKSLYRLLGARDELNKQKKEIDKKLEMITQQLENSVINAKSDNLVGIDIELDENLLEDVQRELLDFM